jgi:putative ABC transport system permease protein
VSTVLINAAEGYSPEEIMNDINIHVKKVKAVQTKEMISGISRSLNGTSDVIGVLIGAVWFLGLVILLLAYSISISGRKREFAVLRMIGASQRKLASVIMQEAALCGISGALTGTGVSLLATLAFRTAIGEMIGLPFLLPGAGMTILLALLSTGLVMLSGMAAAAVSAYRISRMDTALILRGDNG